MIKEAGSTFEQLLSGGGRSYGSDAYEVQRLKNANIALTQEAMQYTRQIRQLKVQIDELRLQANQNKQHSWSGAAEEYKRKAEEQRAEFEKFRQQFEADRQKAKNYQEEMKKQKIQKAPFPSDREMIAFLHAYYEGSYEGRQFIDSLKEWFDNRSSFTEKQRTALKRFYDNCNP